MPTTSLWGVAAKWPTRAPKTTLILCPRNPQGYSRISLIGWILKEYRNIVLASTCGHGVCEIALTEVLATQMGVAQQETTHKSYQSSVLSQLYFPTAIASHNSIFPQLYFLARALFSHSSTQSRGKTELFHTKP